MSQTSPSALLLTPTRGILTQGQTLNPGVGGEMEPGVLGGSNGYIGPSGGAGGVG